MNGKKGIKSKQQIILEAAQKRFAMFGIEKTTMQDIADDLHMVKGSIYYYYPDKENLYKAVIETEQAEFLRVIENEVLSIKDPSECLRQYVLKRLSYFKKLVNLSRMRADSISEYRPLIAGSVADFREKEKGLVQKILERGNKAGDFAVNDSSEAAALFLDLLKGLRSALLSDKKLLFIDDDEYKILTDKALEFTDIYINGLKIINRNK